MHESNGIVSIFEKSSECSATPFTSSQFSPFFVENSKKNETKKTLNTLIIRIGFFPAWFVVLFVNVSVWEVRAIYSRMLHIN